MAAELPTKQEAGYVDQATIKAILDRLLGMGAHVRFSLADFAKFSPLPTPMSADKLINSALKASVTLADAAQTKFLHSVPMPSNQASLDALESEILLSISEEKQLRRDALCNRTQTDCWLEQLRTKAFDQMLALNKLIVYLATDRGELPKNHKWLRLTYLQRDDILSEMLNQPPVVIQVDGKPCHGLPIPDIYQLDDDENEAIPATLSATAAQNNDILYVKDPTTNSQITDQLLKSGDLLRYLVAKEVCDQQQKLKDELEEQAIILINNKRKELTAAATKLNTSIQLRFIELVKQYCLINDRLTFILTVRGQPSAKEVNNSKYWAKLDQKTGAIEFNWLTTGMAVVGNELISVPKTHQVFVNVKNTNGTQNIFLQSPETAAQYSLDEIHNMQLGPDSEIRNFVQFLGYLRAFFTTKMAEQEAETIKTEATKLLGQLTSPPDITSFFKAMRSVENPNLVVEFTVTPDFIGQPDNGAANHHMPEPELEVAINQKTPPPTIYGNRHQN